MYKGTILQYLRKYIKNLQADQLESYLLSGECTLHAIELEPDAIMDWISDILPYTAEIQKVFCSKVDIKIPWAQIKTKPLLIAIQQMEVTLNVHDFREQDWAIDKATEQREKLIHTKIVDMDRVKISEKALKQHELTWIDYVSAGIQLRVEFCKLNLFSNSKSRIPESSHSECSSIQAPPIASLTEPTLAYSIDIEGIFMAPCHHTSGWSVSYVDNPDNVYQYSQTEKTLRLSRLITLKTLSVSTPDGSQILSHSPGFRMRLGSEYTCVNLSKGKGKKRFCIPPFPSSSDSAIWMDRLNISTRCSCNLASFYAILQDLLAPVIVPAECLTPENRHYHYTFNEEEILRAQTQAELEAFLARTSSERSPKERIERDESTNLPAPTLPPIPNAKKMGIIRGSGKSDIKKMFFGLANEVKSKSEKVTEQAQHRTDKIIGQSKQILNSAISGLGLLQKGSSLKRTDGISAKQSIPNKPQTEAGVDASPNASSPGSKRRSRLSSMGSSIMSSESDFFVDAVSGGDEEEEHEDLGSVDASPRTVIGPDDMISGHPDGFGLWMANATPLGGEFDLESQLVIIDKLCYKSFFHLHVNEVGVILSVDDRETVSIIMKRLDMTSESRAPLTLSQTSILASFSQNPEIFFQSAKKLLLNVLCPIEPVHAATSLTASFIQITNTPPGSSPDPQVVILKISNSNFPSMKALSLKWKSRSPPPTRLISGSHRIETARIQPYEGCIHGMQVASEQWTPFMSVYNQLMAWAGDFPDPSLDPLMRMRLCLRDTELVTSSGWKLALPGGLLSRNFSKSTALSQLLSGFQTLTPIPDCHFSESSSELPETSSGFPLDGAFCSCICGQETTSWSWALPTVDPRRLGHYPSRIKLPGRILGSVGSVVERTWKQSQLEDTKSFVYVPVDEFGTLLETKLKVAEQQVLLDQLREQYNSVMGEMTKRNIFLKERWAEDAVHSGSKETVVEILTQKVCVLERLVRELQDTKEADEKLVEELRTVSGTEIAEARKELLEQTQTLKFKIADSMMIQDALQESLAKKDREIEELKSQREFLLGMGLKASIHMSTQTSQSE
jgi:hypothetical protein